MALYHQVWCWHSLKLCMRPNRFVGCPSNNATKKTKKRCQKPWPTHMGHGPRLWWAAWPNSNYHIKVFLIYPRQITKITTNEYKTMYVRYRWVHQREASGNDTARWAYRKERDKMQRWMEKWREVDEEWEEISAESTARGIPSLLRVHDRGSEPSVLIMMALKTAETVWM